MSESTLRAFEPGVLDRYTREPEKYRVEDNVMCGTIEARKTYLDTVPVNRRRLEHVTLGYDKRRLADGTISIRPQLLDFDRLPSKHKQHWRSWEIANPKYLPVWADRDYQRAFEQNYLGQFVEANDSLIEVSTILSHLAKKHEIYKKAENPNLRYPLLNNAKSYSESHNELRKLVGPDNMNVKRIKAYLRQFEIEFTDDERAWSLFKKLVRFVGDPIAAEILGPIEKCSRERSLVAHEIEMEPSSVDEDYLYTFRFDCDQVANALDRLSLKLRWVLERQQEGEPANG